MAYLLSVLCVCTCAISVSSTSTFLIDISLSSAVVAPGSSIQIHCIVNSTHASTFKWFGDGVGEIISSGSKYNLFSGNGTLEINEFSEQDEGQYYCSATNSLGSAISLSTSLVIASIGTAVSTSETKRFQLNQNLELPCTVPVSVPEAEVLWYKGSSLVNPNSRIGLSLNNSLIFSHCLDDDVGTWECRVKNKLIDGEQKSNKYLLTTIDPALNTIQSAEILFSPVGQTVIAGQSLKLQCFAIGRPSPVYTWLKDSDVLEQNSRISFSESSRVLTIVDVSSTDGGSYSCRVDQTTLSVSLVSEPATVVVKDPPSILSPAIESPVSQTQYASLSASLSCKAAGSQPISWSWLRNTDEIEESDNVQIDDSVANNVSQSVLKIQSLSPTDEGVWQCIASNSETGSAQATQLLTVNTTSPEISEYPSDALAFVGDNVTLRFTCTSYPYPTFSWIENNEAITLQQRHSVGGTNPFYGGITIAPAQANDGGVYRVSCSNDCGIKTSPGVIIKIISKPVVQVEPQDTLVSLGSDVMVHCMISDYNDIATDYSWKRDFDALPESGNISSYTNGTILIKSFSVDDIGYYECTATLTSESSDASPLTYVIGGAYLTEDPPTRPSSPTNLLLGDITSRSTSIQWDKPTDNGGLQILGYTVEVKNLGRADCAFDEDFNTTFSSMVTEASVTLRPYSRYTISLYAFNSLGYSNSSKETDVFWTVEEEPSLAPVVTLATQGENVGELIITWDHPPCQNRNGRITSYAIKLTSATESPVTLYTSGNSTSFVMKQLRALEEYTVQVSASTGAGNGPFSEPLTAKTTLASVPDVPRNLNIVEVSFTSFTISWESPIPRENEPINEQTNVTWYVVRCNNNEEVNVTDTRYTAVDLHSGSTVVLSVAGVNSFGRGDSANLNISLRTELPVTATTTVSSPSTTVATTPVINTTSSVAFYQELWFPAFAGGIAGGTVLAVVLICVLICVISYCCRKNSSKHNRSFSSSYTASGSVNSFTYPNRKSTVLDKMMQVEMMDSPVPPTDDDDGDTITGRARTDTIGNSGNGPDSSSMNTLSLSQSSGTLLSKYQYRSPMEQEEYQRLSDFRRSTSSDVTSRPKVKTNSSKKHQQKTLSTFKNTTAKVNSASSSTMFLTREASPTDTVSSFEYQSRSQVIPQMDRTRRLPSYTTDGYDTSSEDDSVFHHVQSSSRTHNNPVVRDNNLRVKRDPKRLPNLALMTALPSTSGPPFMPHAIPTPQPVDSPSIPNQPIHQLNRFPKSRSASNSQQFHVNGTHIMEEKATFV